MKDARANREKLTPCPCGHTIDFEYPMFFAQKSADVRIWRILSPLSTKCPHWTIPLTADVFYEQPLTPLQLKSFKNKVTQMKHELKKVQLLRMSYEHATKLFW